ncbi:MAG TPA: choice-of-anchor tandem repeat GloVer-containing protein [Chthoniobacterales bacterium]|nr:choice-of-anchor tandem repeat GloVer-containing protein [Chthoniobacterales bacterium]
MMLLRFLGFPYAASTGARIRSQRRHFEIRAASSRGALPAIFLALFLCLGAPAPESVGTEFEVLKYFTDSDGAHPFSELVQGSDGMLYGTTTTGNNSAANDTIFKINPDGSGFTVLMDFDEATTGGNCWGGLLLGSDDVLYGTTFSGGDEDGGTVFKINQDGTDFAVLTHFDTATTGGGSYARLMEVDKVLYGVTYLGGSNNAGTLFKLNMDGSDFAVVMQFKTSTGTHSTAALVQGPDGALYGTTLHGGSLLYGTIFKVDLDGRNLTVLQHMDASTTGAYPQSRLLLGTDGVLYGTATEGGDYGTGTIFKLNPDGSDFTILKSLEYPSAGTSPYAGLIEGVNGKLYGSTLRGGTYDWGTVFEINPDGTGYRILKRFDYTSTGGFLYAGVTQGSDGALYGAAGHGWDDDFGTLFRILPTANVAPTASAGDDQSIHAGTIVDLAGGASFDDTTSSSALVYAWSFSSRPSGSTATLEDAGTATPIFTADRKGAYVVQLIVTDEDGLSSTADTVAVTSSNEGPTAVATADFTEVLVDEQVHLDGSASTDPENDTLTFVWTLGDVPSGSTAVLIDADTEFPTLTPDVPGDYEVILTVSDSLETGAPDTVTITATNP